MNKTLLHANKMQAEVIGELRTHLATPDANK